MCKSISPAAFAYPNGIVNLLGRSRELGELDGERGHRQVGSGLGCLSDVGRVRVFSQTGRAGWCFPGCYFEVNEG